MGGVVEIITRLLVGTRWELDEDEAFGRWIRT
jgi:hypothetical protein